MDQFNPEELYPKGASSYDEKFQTGSDPMEIHDGEEEPVSRSAYKDSVRVSTQPELPGEVLQMIHNRLDKRDKQSFGMASKKFNAIFNDPYLIELNRKLNALFGENHVVREQMRNQFVHFLSDHKININYKEQLYWFDFIKFLNGGTSISCEGVEVNMKATGWVIFELSKRNGVTGNRIVAKNRTPDDRNQLTYYINGVESREDGPSSIITNRVNGDVEQEFYKHAGRFRAPDEGPGEIMFDEGKRFSDVYYINEMEASDGSFPNRITWHQNGAMNMRVYRKADFAYVDREMIVRECWRPDGTLGFITENIWFDGRYWLNKTTAFRRDGVSVRKEEYKRIGPNGVYVLHRENGPAVLTYHVGGGVTTEFWLDGRQQ